jgi:hypothetical protein
MKRTLLLLAFVFATPLFASEGAEAKVDLQPLDFETYLTQKEYQEYLLKQREVRTQQEAASLKESYYAKLVRERKALCRER